MVLVRRCHSLQRHSSNVLAHLVSLISQVGRDLDTAEVVLHQQHGMEGKRHRESSRALIGDLVTIRHDVEGTGSIGGEPTGKVFLS